MYFQKEIQETCRAIVNIKLELREYQNQEVKGFYQAKKIEELSKELRVCECLLKEYLELS
jgi:hypothetical protein